MLEKVDHFIAKHELIEKNSTVVIGVSGGADSVALLHYLWMRKREWNLYLIVAHVNHMFRGEESVEDYNYVEKLCEQFNLPFEGIHIDVPSYQKEKNLSVQVAARECRYQFFEKTLKKHDADYLALAHHGDDQIETMLMRLVRGSSTNGLSGIQVKRSLGNNTYLIRPFLSVSKEDIEKYCIENNLESRLDPSNQQDSYMRNRFRHHVLPFLKQENPKVHERFQYTSELLRLDDQYLNKLAKEKLENVLLHSSKKRIILSVDLFQATPISLQRRVIHLILEYLYGNKTQEITSIHIENVYSFLLREHPSGELNLPYGLKINRSYDECEFTYSIDELTTDPYNYILNIPGIVEIHPFFMIKAREFTQNNGDLKGSRETFFIKKDDIHLPLIVRSRKPGDRMELKGMKGSKKIKDIFIDEKVPHYDRQRWPIVTDSSGMVLWLPLLRKSPYEFETIHNNMVEGLIKIQISTKFP